MKKLFAIIIICVITLSFTSCVKTYTNIDNYAKDVEEYCAGAFMPKLNGIGEYKNIEYLMRADISIFPGNYLKLVAQYDKENFSKEKERLKTAYTYLDEPQKPDWGNDVYTIPLVEFSYAGFDFKVAKFEDTIYPKNFGMVGISDENFEIAYLWFYSPDQDYICEVNDDKNQKMNEFIEYHFSIE